MPPLEFIYVSIKLIHLGGQAWWKLMHYLWDLTDWSRGLAWE